MSTTNPKMTAVIKILCNELKDPAYRLAWTSNIAMSFQDEAKRQKSRDSNKKLHEISNKAAENFIKLLEKDK